MSPNGDPGGNSRPGNGLLLVTTVCVVEIFTTEGISLSARSAKDAGTEFEFEFNVNPKVKIIAVSISLIFFILIFNIINNNKSYYCKNHTP
tara:strand:+ start:412 stop:684 length:273 start_codon:yes stop_codon:yes gene_type:complete